MISNLKLLSTHASSRQHSLWDNLLQWTSCSFLNTCSNRFVKLLAYVKYFILVYFAQFLFSFLFFFSFSKQGFKSHVGECSRFGSRRLRVRCHQPLTDSICNPSDVDARIDSPRISAELATLTLCAGFDMSRQHTVSDESIKGVHQCLSVPISITGSKRRTKPILC